MKPSEVYRKAAKLLEDGGANGWSCWAIEITLGVPPHDDGDPLHPLVRKYEQMFKPEGSNHWWDWVFDKNSDGRPKDLRVLALCFMAAIAEDEERSSKRRS